MPSEPAISPDDLRTRIGLLFALLVIGAVSSLFPVLCSRLRRKKKGASAKEAAVKKPWKDIVFSLLNCFAGGVFLGVTFLHLLPDITTDWEKILSQIWPSSYPFDKFLVVIGFFVVLIIEQMAYTCQRTRPSKKTEEAPLLQGGEGNAVGKGVEERDEATSPGGLRAVFFGLALAVHSVLEGLAFGLIESENDVGSRTLMCT